MDPVQKLWMYENWLEDHNDRNELAKNHAYLVASFWNPEAVSKILSADTHSSNDEEFEESSKMVKEMNIEKDLSTIKRKRKRRILMDKSV